MTARPRIMERQEPLILALLCFCFTEITVHGNGIPLHFSYITTKTGEFISSGSIPVVDLALEQINNRTDILPGYSLNYTSILDTKCDHAKSLDAFMKHFWDESEPTYLTLLCCGCSKATISVADVSHFWNIPQMAGIAGADVLNNRERFRGFFRTLPSFEFVGPSLAEIARQFSWTQMAIISQRENLFTLITESLKSIFESEQQFLETTATIEINANPFPYHLLFNWVKKSQKRDIRIIIINTNPPYGYLVLCEAYHREMFAPKYVWITPSWYSRGWWNEDYGNSSCTPDIIKTMLNNSLAIAPNGYFVSDNVSIATKSGLTPEQYENEYLRRLQMEYYQAENLTEFILSGSTYDAVWALALGLHIASEKVIINDSSGCSHLSGNLVQLEEFDYHNDLMGCILRNSFHQVKFTGITGQVDFNSNGSRVVNTVRVQQYHVSVAGNVTRANVADVEIFSNYNRFVFKENVTAKTVWPGGVPYDGAAIEKVHPLDLALTTVSFTMASAGLVFTLVCLLFNIVFRNKKVVKLSSPNLNYIIIAGVALLYVSVYMYTFSAEEALTQTILCNFRQWLFSLGYTLCFAVLLTKTGRVYYIFTNPTPNKKIPRDWVLLVMILLVVAVDLTIVLIGTSIPTSRLNATLISDVQHKSYTDLDGISYDTFVFVCNKDNSAVVWLSISYAYKGLLQILAMFMAFHTRRIKIKALNDSKEIAVIIYINSITLSLLALVEFALGDYHEVYAALFGLSLLVGATLFLALLFIPRMVQLIKDPKGETVMDHSTTKDKSSYHVGSQAVSYAILQDEVAQLKQKVSELEKELEEVKHFKVLDLTLNAHSRAQLFQGEKNQVGNECD